jgi:uncharacterized protein YciI
MRGPAWDHSSSLEGQAGWTEHAAFMDSLVDDGFVLLGGPLDDGRPLLIIDAEGPHAIEERLSADPWVAMGLLLPGEIHRWQLRLGDLGANRRLSGVE